MRVSRALLGNGPEPAQARRGALSATKAAAPKEELTMSDADCQSQPDGQVSSDR